MTISEWDELYYHLDKINSLNAPINSDFRCSTERPQPNVWYVRNKIALLHCHRVITMSYARHVHPINASALTAKHLLCQRVRSGIASCLVTHSSSNTGEYQHQTMKIWFIYREYCCIYKFGGGILGKWMSDFFYGFAGLEAGLLEAKITGTHV